MSRWPNQVLAIENAHALKPNVMSRASIDWLDFKGEGVFFILGFGDGGTVREILKRTKTHLIVVYEKNVNKLKWALKSRDLKNVLGSSQVLLLSGDQLDFGWMHVAHNAITNGSMWMITDKLATKEDRKEYSKIADQCREVKNFLDINLSTQISIGKKFANSILKNVPAIIRSNGITDLYGRFNDVPAIVVSSGPSLDNEIENLRAAKGKALIFCVDTALPTLLKNNIKPDFCVGIDPLPDNNALFKIKGARDIPFICMAQYTPDVLKKHRGPLFVSAQNGSNFYNWLHWFWPDKGNLETFGGSVSHYGLNVAEYLGCNVVGLLGQDLCFKSKYHAGGVTKLLHDGMGLPEPDDTIDALKMKNCKGEDVYTKPTLISFKTGFEAKIQEAGTRLNVVNLTREGLLIKGAARMPLKRFLSRYGKEFSFTLPEHIASEKANITGLLERIDGAIKVLRRIVKLYHRVLKLIHKTIDVRKTTNDKKLIRKYVRKIEKLYPDTKHPLLALISTYHYHLEVYLKRKEIREIDGLKHKWVKLDRQLDRGLNFYAEVIEAADLLIKELQVLKTDLKRMDNTHAEERRAVSGN